jgi:hypothetical protein
MLCCLLISFSWASRRSSRHLGIPILGVRHISWHSALALGYDFSGVELDEHCSVGF